MNKTLLSVGALSVVALVLSGVAYFNPSTKETIREVVKETFGAVSGPNIDFPEITLNGVKLAPRQMGFSNSTTTPCALQSPDATSSLISIVVTAKTATTVAMQWTVATSTTIYATTSPVMNAYIQANELFTLAGATTTGSRYPMLAPNTYVVVGANWKGIGHVPPFIDGTCSALFAY